MFEQMLAQRDEHFRDANYVFYMEPDCRPIKSYWLDSLVQDVGFTDFWMKGSIFRGNVHLRTNYLPNRYHINGNAIYNIGNKDFRDFYFNTLRPYIERHGDSINAYDTDIFEYLFDPENYDEVRKILHNFVLTEKLQNYWHSEYNINNVSKLHPNTYLIHGGSPNDW